MAEHSVSFRLDSQGVRLPGPQFQETAGFDVFDWNLNGLPDIYMHDGGSVGRGAIYLNAGTPRSPRFTHSVYEPFNSTETGPQTLEHVIARAYADLNGNGKRDAIFFDGQLRYAPNAGSLQSPFYWNLWRGNARHFPGSERMIRENSHYATGPRSFFWKNEIFARQVMTFTFADWNGNGLPDLIICRFEDEAPGVESLGLRETWGSWGRHVSQAPMDRGADHPETTYQSPLDRAPARGTYVYLNAGTATEPFYDEGFQLTTPDGLPIVVPNPVVFDVDGDGLPDLVGTEVPYECNAFRVDWPTAPYVMGFRRVDGANPAVLEPGQPVLDEARQPIPAGVMARFADMSGQGVGEDLLVLDGDGRAGIRWYRNARMHDEPVRLARQPAVLTGNDFARYYFSTQPLIVDWFAPGSRDLILHGTTDHHCKFGLRRTALYRNVAQQAGEIGYEFAGWLNYNGDPAMVATSYEQRPYEVYGSAMSVHVDHAANQRRIAMSVGGKLFYFTDLAPDGLTFRGMQRLDIPFTSNRMTDWQQVDIDAPFPVKYIRMGNDRNGIGNLRDSFLHVLQFQAIDTTGANVTNIETHPGVKVLKINTQDVAWYQIQRPYNMLTPGNANTDSELKATSFGFFIEDVHIELEKPTVLEQISFQLSDRDTLWYRFTTPFRWQGKGYPMGHGMEDMWYHYEIKVSADGENWVTVEDRRRNEMLYSFPVLIDWNGNGKLDLLLGYTSSNGIYPSHKHYRLYPNIGTNDQPLYGEPIQGVNALGEALSERAAWLSTYANQAGVAAVDLNDNGKPDLMIEGYAGQFFMLENESTDPGSELKLQRPRWPAVVQIGTPAQPLLYDLRYRYFSVADVDGDGVLDLLVSDANHGLILFRGIHPEAPQPVNDLRVVEQQGNAITLRLTRPAGADGYIIRWSDGDEVNAVNFQALSGSLEGAFDVAPGEAQEVVLENAEISGWITLGARVVAKEKQSPLSNIPRVLVQPSHMVTHAPVAAVSVDAAEPEQVTPADAKLLHVRAQRGTWGGEPQKDQKVVLLRFADLPTTAIDHAELTMHLARTGQANTANLIAPIRFFISANTIDGGWDPAAASWSSPGEGRNWPEQMLESGGKFAGFAQPTFAVQHGATLRWNVTAAVRAAQQQGRTQIDLMLRVDYTGHYVSQAGFNLCGPGWEEAEHRPSLVLAWDRP